MEDIVGIKIKDKIRGSGALITWGRLFDTVDEAELLGVVKKHLTRWGIEDLESMSLCYSLTEIADQPYFYECLIKFIQEPIPYGASYEAWKRKKKKALKNGDDIYFTGFMNDYMKYLKNENDHN